MPKPTSTKESECWIDARVNNAGIFFNKPFTDYTAQNFKSLVSTNVEGFLYITNSP